MRLCAAARLGVNERLLRAPSGVVQSLCLVLAFAQLSSIFLCHHAWCLRSRRRFSDSLLVGVRVVRGWVSCVVKVVRKKACGHASLRHYQEAWIFLLSRLETLPISHRKNQSLALRLKPLGILSSLKSFYQFYQVCMSQSAPTSSNVQPPKRKARCIEGEVDKTIWNSLVLTKSPFVYVSLTTTRATNTAIFRILWCVSKTSRAAFASRHDRSVYAKTSLSSPNLSFSPSDPSQQLWTYHLSALSNSRTRNSRREPGPTFHWPSHHITRPVDGLLKAVFQNNCSDSEVHGNEMPVQDKWSLNNECRKQVGLKAICSTWNPHSPRTSTRVWLNGILLSGQYPTKMDFPPANPSASPQISPPHSVPTPEPTPASVINLHLLRSAAMLAANRIARALGSAERALSIAREHSIYHLISKSHLYRGLCMMELSRWKDASNDFTRAANVRGWARRVTELKYTADMKLQEEREQRMRRGRHTI